MAYVDTLVNTFGGTWFDMNWNPTIDSPEWNKAITFYVDLMNAYGPPGASSNGANENLTIFATGKVAMLIDATSMGGPLFDKKQSEVADKVAFANAPIAVTPNGSHWLCSGGSQEVCALGYFEGIHPRWVADEGGCAAVPPGTRKSTYENPEYQKAAPFASVTLHAMLVSRPSI